MKGKEVIVAEFIANDFNIANKFAQSLCDESEHRFQAWRGVHDSFTLKWYCDTIGDLDDLGKAIDFIGSLNSEELRLQGIFDFKIYRKAQIV